MSIKDTLIDEQVKRDQNTDLSYEHETHTESVKNCYECFIAKEKTCRFGHICTSGCGNDFDCPCQADHCCAITEDCDGSCDDCFNKKFACDICEDTGVLDCDEQDENGNWQRGVGSQKCECQFDNEIDMSGASEGDR